MLELAVETHKHFLAVKTLKDSRMGWLISSFWTEHTGWSIVFSVCNSFIILRLLFFLLCEFYFLPKFLGLVFRVEV